MAVTRARTRSKAKPGTAGDQPTESDNIEENEDTQQKTKKKTPTTSKVKKQKLKKSPVTPTTSIKTEADTSNFKNGKKLTAYKLAQLRKRQKMIDAANRVKPSFFPGSYLENKETNKVEKFSLFNRLVFENKLKISNVTNYNPIRTAILEGPSKEKLKELKRIVAQPKTLNQLRLPSIKLDENLRASLERIKKELYIENDIQSGNNHVLIKNEMDLHKLSIEPFDRELYSIYLKYKQKSAYIQSNSTHACNPRDPNPLAKEIDSSIIPNFYIDLNKLHNLKFINISKEFEEFELYNMLDKLKRNPDDYNDVEEKYAFDGLDVTDFTTNKEFRGLELI